MKWGVFISGRGSNLVNLLNTDIDSVGLVLSDRPSAQGLVRARRRNIPIHILPKPIDWTAADRVLEKNHIDHLLLLGFMKLLPAHFLENWTGRIFNLHPSLLPTYPGLHSIERSHAERAPMGVTIHHVIPEMDAGKIVSQRRSVPSPLVSSQVVDLPLAQILIARDEQGAVRRFWQNHGKTGFLGANHA